jgi:phage-related protein
MVIKSALWVVSIPVKLYRHDKRYRNLYKEVNAILGYH